MTINPIQNLSKDKLFSLYESGLVIVITAPHPEARKLIAQFAEKHGTTAETLRGKSRLRPIAYLRQECMAMLKKQTVLTLPEIGRLLNRDHTTVLHGIKQFKKRSRQGISHRAFSQEVLGAVE